MSPATPDRLPRRLRDKAPLFAALGDETRLGLLIKLSHGGMHSIKHLAIDSTVTRQAIRKHLQILESVGLVRSEQRGRETLFQIEPKPIDDAKRALEEISQQWDRALARLKTLVEE